MKHFFLIAFLSLAFSLQECERARRPSRYLIPEGYVGWVNVHFEVREAPALPIEEGRYLFKVLPSGQLSTSTRLEGGTASDDYYYVSTQGLRRKLESSGWGEGGMIWAQSNSEVNLRFFVGTEGQLQDHGFQMNPQIGPIPQH